MGFYRLKCCRLGVGVAWGAVWVALLAMLCDGMFPQTGVCLCEGCSCSASISSKRSEKEQTVPPRSCCCSKKKAQPSSVGKARPQQCGCSTGSPCKCRSSETSGSRITAIRSSSQSQRDNVKKSFEIPAWNVVKVVSALVVVKENGVWTQYAPHIHLPRFHLLLSVWLN
jgi:hypothetical protein